LDVRPLVAEVIPGGVVVPIQLLLAAEHPLVLQAGQPGEAQIVPAIWLSNVLEPAVDAIRTKGDLLPGILINAGESATSLGNSLPSPLWLQRPRGLRLWISRSQGQASRLDPRSLDNPSGCPLTHSLDDGLRFFPIS